MSRPTPTPLRTGLSPTRRPRLYVAGDPASQEALSSLKSQLTAHEWDVEELPLADLDSVEIDAKDIADALVAALDRCSSCLALVLSPSGNTFQIRINTTSNVRAAAAFTVPMARDAADARATVCEMSSSVMTGEDHLAVSQEFLRSWMILRSESPGSVR